ncbi:hypothetical protein QQ045_019689 [Rhodiola kirilowii]
MGTFLVFIRKYIFCCVLNEEEEKSELPKSIPVDTTSSGFDGISTLVSQSLSSISSGITGRFNDEPSNSHCGAEKTQASVCFSDTAVNKLISDDVPSYSECDYTDDSSNEIVICLLPKAVTEPDSQPKESEIFEEIISEEVELINPGYLQSEFDAALTNQETRNVPNFPESCTEPPDKASTSSETPNAVERRIQDYCSSQKILLVGEGDFSFSACLAKAFGSATNMVATSLDSKAYLKRHYKNAMNNISQLRMRGCEVFHGVDATNMNKDWRIFDRIIYNFPHSSDFRNTEDALWGNQLLIKQFMENAVEIIEEDGEIHIRHKSNWYFWRWNLRGLASEVGGLVLIEEAPFDPCEFSGYNTKHGFRSDKNFNCHPSCTYKFVLSKRQKKLRRKNKMLNA